MKKETLKAKKRIILGKKVKHLRKQGLLPATVYGKKIKSESLEVEQKEFIRVYKKAGKTGLVELVIEGHKEAQPVLIHGVQKDPVTDKIIHTDFYQVDLKEKVKAVIPVLARGEAKAVSENKGVLLHILSKVEAEALPADLLEHIEVDVSQLSEVDQAILVKDLPVDKKLITILTQPLEIVFKVGALITKEVKEALKAEEEAKKAAEAQTAEAIAPEGAEKPVAPEKKEEVKEEKA